MIGKLKNIFKSYFIAGLLVLGPLVISIYFIQTVIQGTDTALQTSRWFPFQIPGLGFVFAIIIILVAGFLGKNVFGKFIFTTTGEILGKIPVIGTIYSSMRQVFDTLLGDRQKNFARVVLIQYPSPATWTLAFVTSEGVPPELSGQFAEKMISVYVPTTPNPTSGFYLFVSEAQVKAVNMSVEHAFKSIVSLGLVQGKS